MTQTQNTQPIQTNGTIAICADVHGDIKKFRKFAEQTKDVKATYILGDLLNFGLDKRDVDCLRMARDLGYHVVQGNHDEVSLKSLRLPLKRFKEFRHLQPTNEDITFLRELPYFIMDDDMIFAHNFPIGETAKIRNPEDAKEPFRYLIDKGARVGFHGHFHTPTTLTYNPTINEYSQKEADSFELNHGLIYLVNPGALKADNFILLNGNQVERRKL